MKISITDKKLAEFSVSTPSRQREIVREMKQPGGRYRWYQSYAPTARKFWINNAQDPIAVEQAIAAMLAKADTPRKKMHAEATEYALREMLKDQARIAAMNKLFSRPPSAAPKCVHYPDVEVKIAPDLMVQNWNNGVYTTGAVRFYTSQDAKFQLGPQGTELIAVLLFQWLAQHSTGFPMPVPSECYVYQCFQHEIVPAPKDMDEAVKLLRASATEFARLWNDGMQAA